MRKLLATSNASLVQSLRLALEGEGIEAAVAGETLAPIQPITIWVADADFDHASALLSGLQTTPSPTAASSKGRRIAAIALLLGALAIAALCVEIL